MWMIRWFFIALVVFLITVFIAKNWDLEPISIDYIFDVTGEMSPLMAMFFSFALGFLSWFVVSLFNFMKMRSEITAKNKVIRNLKQELNEYRNVTLADRQEGEKTVSIMPEGVGQETEIRKVKN